MRQYHMISAKRMGWDTIYDYYPFPTDKYSEESVRNQFKKITRETQKSNGVFYEYTAYEFCGEIYYSIIYDGIYDEDNLLGRGFIKEELDNL